MEREPPPKRKAGRPRSPTAGASIRRAAQRILLERGAQSLSVEGVARDAHVAKTTIYRRWPSAEALVVDMAADLFARLDEPAETPNGAAAGSAVGSFVERRARLLNDPMIRAMLPIIAMETIRNTPLAEQLSSDVFEPMKARRHRNFEAAVQAGEIDRGVDEEAFFAAITGAMLVRALQGRPIDKDFRSRLIGLVLQGAAPAGK